VEKTGSGTTSLIKTLGSGENRKVATRDSFSGRAVNASRFAKSCLVNHTTHVDLQFYLHSINSLYYYTNKIGPVPARSWTSRTPRSWVRITLEAWLYVHVFLCYVVLCRYRPCDGAILRPRSPIIMSERIQLFQELVLNQNRSQA
jgi:hypothetical protein